MGIVQHLAGEAHFNLKTKHIRVVFHTAVPSEREWKAHYQTKIGGITDDFHCVPSGFAKISVFAKILKKFVRSSAVTVVGFDGCLSRKECMTNWMPFDAERKMKIRSHAGGASFNPAAVASFIYDILFPKDKDRSG